MILNGACLRFNSGKNMNGKETEQNKNFQSGSKSGLEMEIFIGDVDQNRNVFSKEHGYIIFIQNKTDFDSADNEGISISPGTSTRIILSKNSWKKEPSPYIDCINDLTTIESYPSQTFKDSFSQNKTYSYFDCYNTCYFNFIKLKCNCCLDRHNKDERVCYVSFDIIEKDIECIINNSIEFSKNPLYLRDCDCPFECERTFYTYLTSYSQFPTLQYSSYLLESDLIKRKYPNITYEQLKKSVARVQIFYDEMKETVIEESVKTEISDLISNLGGTLGLFLGLSFLSLIEFVEAFLQGLFVLTKIKNNKTQPENQ